MREKSVQRPATLSSAGVAAVALSVLLGWYLPEEHLRLAGNGLEPMRPNTALAVLALAALALGPLPRRFRVGLALFVILLGAFTLGEHAVGASSPLDVLTPGLDMGGARARMAAATALGLTLLALGHGARLAHRLVVARCLGAAGAVLGWFGLVSHAYDVERLTEGGAFASMSVASAGALVALGAGLVMADADEGMAAAVHDKGPAGRLVGLMLAFLFVATPAFGLIWLSGVENGAFDSDFGMAMLVTSTTVPAALLLGITAVRLHGATARRAEERAHAAKAQDAFLASMHHELRTPLNAIIGFSGTLLMEGSATLATDQHDQVEAIHDAGKDLLRLVEGVLDVTQLDSGSRPMARRSVPLADATEAAVQAVADRARAKGLTITASVPADLAVLADRDALHQVVLQVVTNAVTYTDEGRVTLTARRVGRYVELACVDTGRGIDPSWHERVFDAFERVDDPTRPVSPGTGLGLYLSRRLTELMGGTIRVESTPGQGSAFLLQLRAA